MATLIERWLFKTYSRHSLVFLKKTFYVTLFSLAVLESSSKFQTYFKCKTKNQIKIGNGIAIPGHPRMQVGVIARSYPKYNASHLFQQVRRINRENSINNYLTANILSFIIVNFY